MPKDEVVCKGEVGLGEMGEMGVDRGLQKDAKVDRNIKSATRLWVGPM